MKKLEPYFSRRETNVKLDRQFNQAKVDLQHLVIKYFIETGREVK